jgi:Cell differentiation family, Rcd1-like
MTTWLSFYGTLLVRVFKSPQFLRSPCYSVGIMPALLQEIVSVYPLLSPPNLTAHVSNRVCNALALLQCVASHPETRQLFLNGIFQL